MSSFLALCLNFARRRGSAHSPGALITGNHFLRGVIKFTVSPRTETSTTTSINMRAGDFCAFRARARETVNFPRVDL